MTAPYAQLANVISAALKSGVSISFHVASTNEFFIAVKALNGQSIFQLMDGGVLDVENESIFVAEIDRIMNALKKAAS